MKPVAAIHLLDLLKLLPQRASAQWSMVTGCCYAQDTASPAEAPPANGRVLRLLGALAAAGALLGPPLDGIHTRVGLLQYDSLPLTLGVSDAPLLAVTCCAHWHSQEKPCKRPQVCWSRRAIAHMLVLNATRTLS